MSYGCVQLLVGLRPREYVNAVVDEPFHVTCLLKNVHGNIDSSMLEFCIQHPNSSSPDSPSYARIVNRTSIKLDYTLHAPSQNIMRTKVWCFLKNSSVKCDMRNPKKSCTVVAGCE